MSKILQGLNETLRERVKRVLGREAKDRLDIVEDVVETHVALDRGGPEHEALLRWAFSGLAYSVEEIERQIKAGEVNRQ